MAIDPELIVIKRVSELETTNSPKDILASDDLGNLKRTSYSNIASIITTKPIKLSDPSPSNPGWYKPAESGTYSNAGGLMAKDGYDTLFYFDGSTWTLSSIKMLKENTSDNILLKADKTRGQYIDHSNGQTIDYPPYTTTDFMQLDLGIHYSFGPYISSSSGLFYAFYDENKNYINDSRSYNKIFDFKLPANAKYARFSYETINESSVYLIRKTDVLSDTWGINLLKDSLFYNNFYVDQNSGGNLEVTSFSVSDYICIDDQRALGINPDSYQQFAFYDKDLQYIVSDLSVTFRKDFFPPSGARYMRMTVRNDELGINYLKVKNPQFSSKIILVGKGVTDFPTIQKAVDYANSTGERHTIRISNGIYLEELMCDIGVGHSLIGESKAEVIISDVNDTDQKWEVLRVKSGYYFESIYFRRMGGGYAVHSDFGGPGRIEFFNCRIESSYGSAVGSGSSNNQTLVFSNCQIIERGDEASTGVMYWHNSTLSAENNQRLEVWNCEIYGFDRALRIDDANILSGDGNMPVGNATVLFVNNSFYSKNYQKQLDLRPSTAPTAGCLVGNILLDERSYGNNIDELNNN